MLVMSLEIFIFSNQYISQYYVYFEYVESTFLGGGCVQRDKNMTVEINGCWWGNKIRLF